MHYSICKGDFFAAVVAKTALNLSSLRVPLLADENKLFGKMLKYLNMHLNLKSVVLFFENCN